MVIDEISMLSGETLAVAEEIARHHQKSVNAKKFAMKLKTVSTDISLP